MTPILFAGLTAAAAVSLLVAIIVYVSNNTWSSGEVAGERLFPGLAGKVNDIARIEVKQGGKELTIAAGDGGWGIAERGGYPAKVDKVRKLIVGLAGAELVEAKTRNKDRYPLLELEDPAGKAANSRLVRLIGKDGKALADVVLGKKRWDAFGSGRSGVYVRKLDDPQTWLTNADIETPLEAKMWVEQTFFQLDKTKMARVTLAPAGGEVMKIEREGAGKADETKFTLSPMPENAKLKKGASIDSIPTAFARLDLEDVRKLTSTPAGDKVSTATIEADEGLKVTFRLRREKDGHWLSLETAGSGTSEKTAADINGQAKGWEFKIPSWKAESLFKSKSDLFETS